MSTCPAPPGVTWRYDTAEIVADGLVHAVGLLVGSIGALALIDRVDRLGTAAEAAPVFIYAAALLAMLVCSAAYNLWPISRTKWFLRRFDHAAIYLLIAGTYTPFLARMGGEFGTALLLGMWGAAATGIVLKVLAPGRFDRLSILLYLLLSWSGVALYDSVFLTIPRSSLLLLIAGGIVYSSGVVFHLWESLRFQNAIWHGFVAAGAALHYFAVQGLVGSTV